MPKRKEQPEFELQKSVCQYLRIKHPKILFMSDTIASVRLTKPQQARNKSIQKQGFKCPDLIIFEPNDTYNGLFIELKNETPYKLNGMIKSSQNDHLKLQEQTLQDLARKGYYACFSWSFEMTINIITEYLNNSI